MSDKENKIKVSMTYKESNGLKPLPVNGAVGAAVPDKGHVCVSFYFESSALPGKVEGVGNRGERFRLSDLEPSQDDFHIEREIQSKLVMTPNNAISIGEWLIDIGRAAQDQEKEK